MKNWSKALAGTAAAAAMVVSTAAPAQARDHRDNDGIGAGEIIAGAVVLGGLAAILSSSKDDRYRGRYDDRYNRDYRYRNNGRYGRISAREAVDRCVRAAETRASRYYGPANVTQIEDVDRTRYGYKIEGDIVVDESRGGYRGYRGRGYNRDYDRGEFTCKIDGSGYAEVDFDDISRNRRW